ncbi:MAG: hypothetical protein ACP5UR_14450, partial [Chloroflexus sp.]|uniref:hypothetical protein n=1 Tax=Chloroflexus sp. TaxID=1904827 RepID=UPI003D152BCC
MLLAQQRSARSDSGCEQRSPPQPVCVAFGHIGQAQRAAVSAAAGVRGIWSYRAGPASSGLAA